MSVVAGVEVQEVDDLIFKTSKRRTPGKACRKFIFVTLFFLGCACTIVAMSWVLQMPRRVVLSMMLCGQIDWRLALCAIQCTPGCGGIWGDVAFACVCTAAGYDLHTQDEVLNTPLHAVVLSLSAVYNVLSYVDVFRVTPRSRAAHVDQLWPKEGP